MILVFHYRLFLMLYLILTLFFTVRLIRFRRYFTSTIQCMCSECFFMFICFYCPKFKLWFSFNSWSTPILENVIKILIWIDSVNVCNHIFDIDCLFVLMVNSILPDIVFNVLLYIFEVIKIFIHVLKFTPPFLLSEFRDVIFK